MCRIYGHFNSEVAANELRAVAALQRHGGPDAHARADGGTWSLGSNRLAIMDPTHGQQPYRLADKTVTVVFNGEIYNHNELRRELQKRGYRFTDTCDGSILPALYEVYGDGFTEQLDGMYAIALLDLRARPRLLLANDHLGMKPVFYHWNASRGELYFSSEIPSLLAFDAVSTTMWRPGLDAYLATKTPFGEQTMFGDIKVLPPATTVICEHGAGLRLLRRPVPAPSNPLPAEDDLAAGDLRSRLRYEVHRLLESDVPAASITSGGLDSSLVTALAAEKATDLHTFNIAYTGNWRGDERVFAQQVAKQAGAVYHQVEIDPREFPNMIEDVVWHLGQPNADPITLSSFALFEAVRDAGFKVALTGDGADELFGGYGRMRAAADAAAAGRPWYQGYLDDLGVLPAAQRAELYTPEYAAELRAAGPAIPQQALDELEHGAGTALDRITAFEIGHRFPAYHLRRVDHMSMAGSVEVRLPFCQPGIVEFGRQLPDRMRVQGGQVKRTLYAAADGLLPTDVLTRPKQPFTLPIESMLRPGWPLWDLAQDMLSADRLRQTGQIDPAAVQKIFATQAAQPNDTASLTLWALLVYEVWRGQFATPHRRTVNPEMVVIS